LALAVDREELVNVVLRGMYAPGTGGFFPPGMPGHSPQIGFPYQPNRARQLLAAAGHAAGSGLPTLEALTVPPVDSVITEYLQAQWQVNLGIQVTWEVMDWPVFSRRWQKDPPHLYILALFADCPDPAPFLGSVGRTGTRWVNQTYNELLEKAKHALDQEVRLGFLQQADQILVHEAPILPLMYGRQHVLVKPWVSSFPISALNCWHWKDTIIRPH
jgi:ABC-type transport system substrate-binding protein